MTKAVTETDLYQMKTLSQPAFGKDYYFVTQTTLNEKDNTYRANILAFNQKGDYVGNFDNDNYISKAPTPGSSSLFFLSKVQKNDTYQLFQMAYSGGSAIQVTSHPHDVESLCVATATDTVFYKTRLTNEVPKKAYEQFPTPRRVNRVEHKADGFGFYPTDGQYQLRAYSPRSKTDTLYYQSKTNFELTDVTSDGSKVALTMPNNPDDDLDFGRGAFVFETSSKHLTNCTAEHAKWVFNDAQFSPDATRLLLVGQTDEFMGNTQYHVYTYNFKTGQLTDHMANLDEEAHDFLFTDFTQNLSNRDAYWVDNNQFTFRTADHGKSKLYLNKDGENTVLFNEPERVTDWCVADQKLLVTYSTTTTPVSFAEVSFEGQQQTLYNPNDHFDEEHTYVTPERFSFKASDGLTVEGWYMSPLHPTDSDPVVLYVHGGPHYAYAENFFFEMQVHAANGYGVVLLNPRGSKTYGQKFCQENVGHYGEKDFTDLMEGLDYVLDHHSNLDRNRQYCAGGSYGGFMTTWVVGHTHRFAGAVAQRPVTDWLSFAGTSDIGFMFIPQEMLTDRFDTKTLWEKSPVAYANKATTPTLVMQGEWDTRTPIGQGEEFYSALIESGIEAEMSRYPQSWHGVSREGLPSLRVRRIAETREWWDQHSTTKE